MENQNYLDVIGTQSQSKKVENREIEKFNNKFTWYRSKSYKSKQEGVL
jgi:hypothetical protein